MLTRHENSQAREHLLQSAATRSARVYSPFFALLPSGAAADVQTPSGCDTRALCSSWNQNCYLGQDDTSYDRYGNYTHGVQEILHYLYYQPIALDGNFGTQTTNRIRDYQGDQGLTMDGIVGAQTWGRLRTHLVERLDDGSWKYYEAAAASQHTQFIFKYTVTNQPWTVINLAGTAYVRFNVAGPQ